MTKTTPTTTDAKSEDLYAVVSRKVDLALAAAIEAVHDRDLLPEQRIAWVAATLARREAIVAEAMAAAKRFAAEPNAPSLAVQ